MTDRVTRSGSLNSTTAFSLEDVRLLISQSEDRILAKLDTVATSLATLTRRLDNIQAEQYRLSLDMTSVKDLVVKQQEQIERMEAEKREKNLVFSNVPEEDIMVNDLILESDIDKLEYLCGVIDKEIDRNDFFSCSRIGRPKAGHKRLLLIKFEDVKHRNRVLFSQKALRDDKLCTSKFGQIYVNKDSTFLIRKEEKRLRERLKEVRADCCPGDKVFIRSGKLYLNSKVVDEIKISNQIF